VVHEIAPIRLLMLQQFRQLCNVRPMRRASSRVSDMPTFTRVRVFCAWASSSAAG
jgi:hypothetical protein